jgi:drug/metabolite transporter (DMT)-like permease
MPFGDALTIMFTSPAVTAILSAVCLKHHLGIYKIGFICSLLCGTVLIIQPPFLFDKKKEMSSVNVTTQTPLGHDEARHLDRCLPG